MSERQESGRKKVANYQKANPKRDFVISKVSRQRKPSEPTLSERKFSWQGGVLVLISKAGKKRISVLLNRSKTFLLISRHSFH